MHKIVALWAIPRSTSTAFEWMMRQRGDLDCLHEPLWRGLVIRARDPLWPRFKEGEKTTHGPVHRERLGQTFNARARKGPRLHWQGFPRTTSTTCGTPDFLGHFSHALLDPRSGQDDLQHVQQMARLRLSWRSGFPGTTGVV